MTTKSDPYKTLLEDLFGLGCVKCEGGKSNNVTHAFNFENPNEYVDFKANFRARLERLAAATSQSSELRKFVVEAANNLGRKSNWDGAYAELAALDFLITQANISPSDIIPNKPSPASETMASEMGMNNVDHDFYIPSMDAYVDVKVLSDKVKQLLEGVVNEATKKAGKPSLRVLFFYPNDLDYVRVQQSRGALVDELVQALSSDTRQSSIVPSSLKEIQFEPAWEPGVYSHASSVSPIEHGKRHHVLMFQHAKKFHRYRPSFIVFVNFPWYGQNLTPFPDSMVSFGSAFADAFFVDYLGRADEARSHNDDFVTKVTCADIAASLTGIMFLNDTSLSSSASRTSLEAFIRINPGNAFHAEAIASHLAGCAGSI